MSKPLIASDPASLAAAAKCFCATPAQQEALKTYLLDNIALVATNPVCTAPSAPTGVSASNARVADPTTQMNVRWLQPANSGSFITGYVIKWGTVSGVYPNSTNVPLTPHNFTVTGLNPGTTYFFVVQAFAFAGCVSANSNEGSNSTSGASLSPATNDWVNRVQINGDPKPDAPVINAYDAWYKCVVAAGIDGKIMANVLLNAQAGRLITNVTPFFHAKGTDPWGAPLCIAGNFGINGLTTGAGSGYLTTGIVPATDFPSNNNAGAACYYYDNPGTNTGFMFACDNAGTTNLFEARYNGAGNYFFTCFFGAGDFISWAAPGAVPFNGWFSVQRTAANAFSAYTANSGLAHAAVGSSANAPGAATTAPIDIWFKNINDNGAVGIALPGTISFGIVTNGLTVAEDNALFNCTQTLLQTIGGGFR